MVNLDELKQESSTQELQEVNSHIYEYARMVEELIEIRQKNI